MSLCARFWPPPRNAVGRKLGRTWKGFYIDEPGFCSERDNARRRPPWISYTPDLLNRFAAAFGYSLRPSLPLLWVERGSNIPRCATSYVWNS